MNLHVDIQGFRLHTVLVLGNIAIILSCTFVVAVYCGNMPGEKDNRICHELTVEIEFY